MGLQVQERDGSRLGFFKMSDKSIFKRVTYSIRQQGRENDLKHTRTSRLVDIFKKSRRQDVITREGWSY